MMKGGETMDNEKKMDAFELDLSEVEELDAVESLWYLIAGSGFALVCD